MGGKGRKGRKGPPRSRIATLGPPCTLDALDASKGRIDNGAQGGQLTAVYRCHRINRRPEIPQKNTGEGELEWYGTGESVWLGRDGFRESTPLSRPARLFFLFHFPFSYSSWPVH